jgi:integrase
MSTPGLHGDGDTLYLSVARRGSKSWIQRIAVNGKRRDIGLGGWPAVSLAQARQRAFANRIAVAGGRDPLAEKRLARVPTFRQAAEKTFEANRPRWRSAKVAANWMQQLERHAFGRLGDMPVDRIGREHVLSVLTPVWTTRPEAGKKLRQRIRVTLQWCMAHGYVEINVAGEAIDGALPSMAGVRQHYRALPYRDVPGALLAIGSSGASLAAKLCFRFLVLTAARSGEARGASWNEIDPETREWRIPAHRMKAGAEHRVPLSDAALAVLERTRLLRDSSSLLFPSPVKAGRQISDATLTKLLRVTGLADRATVHGFRSSFRDWASECTNAPHAVMELSLAHSVGSSVEQAYARSDLFEKRRLLMEQWAAFATEPEARSSRPSMFQ